MTPASSGFPPRHLGQQTGSGLDPQLFALSPEGLSDSARNAALSALSEMLARRKTHALGYQANQAGMYGDLAQYLTLHLNNVGDPFVEGNFTLNSKVLERAVLEFYAKLWHAVAPHDVGNPESYWGYVLTMGCTEGNLYGLWNARDYLAGKVLLDDPDTVPEPSGSSSFASVMRRLIWHQVAAPASDRHAFTPVAFYSEDTHYSVIKIMRILGIQTFYEVGKNVYPGQCPLKGSRGHWPLEVPSEGGALGPGSIDVQALTELVSFFADRGYPILVHLNYGTTFKGAYDDVAGVCAALKPILQRTGLAARDVIYDAETGAKDMRRGFWIHVDGALAATYMPFLEMACAQGKISTCGPIFDFRLPDVHSLATSGHKWIGAPFPTGLYMTRVKDQLRPPSDPAYIGSPDTTLAGSRSGLAPIVLWTFLASHSHEAQMERALRCERLAAYAHARLLRLSKTLDVDLWVQRSPLSLAVLFRQPCPTLVAKYTLSCESLCVDGVRRDYAHVYLMDHVTKDLIDALIDDLSQPDAFPGTPPPTVGPPAASSPASPPGSSSPRPLTHVPLTGRGWR
jgi:histidine decarboxylase